MRALRSSLIAALLGITTLVASGPSGPSGTSGTQGTPGTPRTADTLPRIVALGDSLTSGRGIARDEAYPAILQDRLDEAGLRFEVINAGRSGATSGDGARRLSGALAGDVRVLIVALGANDGLRGVAVERVKSNLSGIITEARARGISVLLCGMEALPLYGLDYSIEFHRVYSDLAREFEIPLVPFMLTGVIGHEEMMQRDRIHPTAAGARLIADNIWPYLKPLAEGAALTKNARN
jgi:acyl-CoA thioesterase-1